MAEGKDAFRFQEGPIEEIPTPDKVPQSLSFDAKKLTEDIEFSRSFETVLQQNQDLMNRLSVQLKRSSNLESRLAHSERERRRLEERVHSFDDEITVLNKSLRDLQTEVRKKQGELASAEGDIGHMHEALTQKTEEIESQKRRLLRHYRYRDRIQKYVRRYLRSLQSRQKELEARHSEILSEKDYQTHRLSELNGEIQKLKESIEIQRQNHDEELKSLSERYERDISSKDELSQSLEERLNQVNERLEKTSKENQSLKSDNIKLHNDLQVQQRRNRSLEEKFDKDLQEAQSSHTVLQENYHALKSDFEDLKKENAGLLEQIDKLKAVGEENEKLDIRLRAKTIDYEEVADRFKRASLELRDQVTENQKLKTQISALLFQQGKKKEKESTETLSHVETVLKDLQGLAHGAEFSASSTTKDKE